jgi:CubicO group peptidase (beta-lactamase class C family)
MYDLCIPAIEILAKESVEAYLNRTSWEPLGMNSTSFRGEGGVDAAEGHVRGDEDLRGTNGEAPPPGLVRFGAKFGFQGVKSPIAWKGAGGLVSCAEDMVSESPNKLTSGEMARTPAQRSLLSSDLAAHHYGLRLVAARELHSR